MKVFACQNCGQLLHFENVVCMRCGATLGFLPASLTLSALDLGAPGDRWTARADGEAWRQCANLVLVGCNWMTPAEPGDALCPSCALDRTIPDLSVAGNAERWRALETAKRRLVYALMRLGLPLASKREDAARGLAFDFLADAGPGQPVMTGHADGLVTINIAEADSAERERRRVELGEPYRTLLGHLRHEVGHYYWDVLVRDGGKIEAARAVFGDESLDYQASLTRHYAEGPPAGWEESFVSAYATMHPWEDFAETWTHYLHMVDTLDTAASFGMAIGPGVSDDPSLEAETGFDPYRGPNFDRLVAAWLPLTVAVNSLSRSMGQPDLYPFALTPETIEKLRFIHGLVHGRG
jgi:hypothetical protein